MGGIAETAKEVIATVIGAEAASLSTDSDIHNTGGWDSLNFIEVVAALESRFSVRFSPGEVAQMFSLRNIIRLIEAKSASGSA